LVGFECGKKRHPVLVEQDQDGIGHLGGQRLVAVQVLEAMEDLRVGEVRAFVNEGLTNLVIRLIVQVFRGKGGGIDACIVRMIFSDEVALNQLHREPPMPGPGGRWFVMRFVVQSVGHTSERPGWSPPTGAVPPLLDTPWPWCLECLVPPLSSSRLT
jgi:hypothetical protein